MPKQKFKGQGEIRRERNAIPGKRKKEKHMQRLLGKRGQVYYSWSREKP